MELSSIAEPAGTLLDSSGTDYEETAYADVDSIRPETRQLVRVPGRHEINRIADRRPAFYGPLVESRNILGRSR
jgi:hypothetical protein